MAPKFNRAEAMREPEYQGVHAMIGRLMVEQDQRTERMRAQGNLPPAVPDHPKIVEISADIQTAFVLDALEGGEFDLVDYIDQAVAVFDDDTLIEAVGGNDPEAEDVEIIPDKVREYLKGYTLGVAALIKPTQGNWSITDTYRVAQDLAAQRGVPVAAIFESDEYYADWMRVVFTPAQFIAQTLQNTLTLNAEDIAAFQLQQTLLANEIVAEEYPGEIEEAEAELRAMAEDPEFVAEINAALALMRYCVAHEAVREITRFWGPEAVNALPPELKQQLDDLLVQPPEVPLTDSDSQ